ncbi:tryptophan--tRNA ligase [Patescibacteria group bacterium]
MKNRNKPILFSGVQPSGELHIGNYLGALRHWVELQNSKEFKPIFSIVDYHSITQDYDPKEKQEQILNTAIDFLSIGIDPKKSIIFVQSQVPEHTELAWILNCITPVSELERMTQYKDKGDLQKDNINMGLFDYPVLMAADILLYKTAIVPVGEDQRQHIELAKIIARKFNHRFKTNFMIEPKAKFVNARRIMSLTQPDKKMSKSLGEKSYIALSDSPKIVQEKIKSAVTDLGKQNDEFNGGLNLVNLFSFFSKDTELIEKFRNNYKGDKGGKLKYSELKPALANAIIAELKPIQEKRKYYLNNPKKVAKILSNGQKQAKKIASQNLLEIKKIIGLL